MLVFNRRKMVKCNGNDGEYKMVIEKVEWDPKKTACIMCDMWDQHWCKNATKRVAEMASRMNELVKFLRQQGVLIIHAPSDTMDCYAEHPARKRAQNAPVIEEIKNLSRAKYDPKVEGPFPIDDSDGGCDCEEKCEMRRAWSKQIDVIEIMDQDAIADNLDAIYLMKQNGIENVMIMGVHTNMCILGRPFAIRNLVKFGLNVVLVRDLTDSMYNPRMWPYTDHYTGTDLVIEHIEKYWCGTVTSDQFFGGKPFKFKGDTRCRN